MLSLNKRRGLIALIVIVCPFLIIFTTCAQEGAIRLPQGHTNLIVEAITDVPLRRTPPNRGYIFITGPRDIIGFIEKGEKVKVQGKKVLRTFFGDDIWVRVKRVNQEKKAGGWVYFGTPDSSPYFRRATSEE
jgi:hypothetical protein